jgi:2-octaprenyl-6-methoxyphenol hydroxylase
MTAIRRVDIAVVGGGLAGLLAALRLASTGRKIVLVAPPRAPDRRTTALLGPSVDALKAAGVFEPIAGVAQPLRAIRIIDATGRLLRAPEVLFDAAEIGLDAFGFNVPNEPLLSALEAATARAGVDTIAAKAVALRHAPNSAIVETDGGDEIEADLAVAADGRHSPSRAAIGIDMRVTALPQSALVCDVAHEFDHGDVSNEFHTPSGPFTFVPLAERKCGLVWVTAPSEAERLSRLPPAPLAELIERQSQAILGRIEIAGPVQIFPLASGLAKRFGADRTVLTGEAAHVLPPIAAQGFNLTVRDIDQLHELLLDRRTDAGSPKVIFAYRRHREADARLRLEAVRLVNGTLLSELLPVQFARGAGLFALAYLPPIRRLIMREGLAGG